jgi:hypothetical protein
VKPAGAGPVTPAEAGPAVVVPVRRVLRAAPVPGADWTGKEMADFLVERVAAVRPALTPEDVAMFATYADAIERGSVPGPDARMVLEQGPSPATPSTAPADDFDEPARSAGVESAPAPGRPYGASSLH